MASVLLKLSQALTPVTFINPVDYDGVQWRWRYFVVRPRLLYNELRYEPYFLLVFFVYIAFIFYGKSCNSRLANAWLNAHLPLFSKQFSRPTNNGLTSDGNSDFFNFSTGRSAVVSLHSVFTLRPRHDLLQLIFQLLWRLVYDLEYRALDRIELDFKLSDDVAVNDHVFAIVSKDEMKAITDHRWDLTFTAVKENPNIPPNLVVMSEFADVTENVLALPATQALIKAVSDPAVLPYFLSLSITDQPRERPLVPPAHRQKHVILSLVVPDPSHADATLSLVAPVFELIDSLGRINLRPDTKAKLRKVREEFDKSLKEDAIKDKKEELEEEKREKRRKAEEARISKLGAAEQQKALERERKRASKKAQAKVVKK